MAADRGEISFEVRMAWWWPLWVWCMVWVAVLSGCDPDWQKVERKARSALRLRPSKGAKRG